MIVKVSREEFVRELALYVISNEVTTNQAVNAYFNNIKSIEKLSIDDRVYLKAIFAMKVL